MPEDDPKCKLIETIGDLQNNVSRMEYPAYHQAGLPTSTRAPTHFRHHCNNDTDSNTGVQRKSLMALTETAGKNPQLVSKMSGYLHTWANVCKVFAQCIAATRSAYSEPEIALPEDYLIVKVRKIVAFMSKPVKNHAYDLDLHAVAIRIHIGCN